MSVVVPDPAVPERSVPSRSAPAPAPDPVATPAQTVKVVNIANGLTLLRLLLVPVFALGAVPGRRHRHRPGGSSRS